MELVLLLTAALMASANARSLGLGIPEARFASLEGFTMDADNAESVRSARHVMDFAEFDRPLSADDVDADPHHRFARDAEPCDCADNPDLMAEMVETAPVLEEQYLPEVSAPAQPQTVYELVEAPEERSGVVLTAEDSPLEDDQEATLCEEGLHPEDEADVEPCAGRPARQTLLGANTEAKAAEAVQVDGQDQTVIGEESAASEAGVGIIAEDRKGSGASELEELSAGVQEQDEQKKVIAVAGSSEQDEKKVIAEAGEQEKGVIVGIGSSKQDKKGVIAEDGEQEKKGVIVAVGSSKQDKKEVIAGAVESEQENKEVDVQDAASEKVNLEESAESKQETETVVEAAGVSGDSPTRDEDAPSVAGEA